MHKIRDHILESNKNKHITHADKAIMERQHKKHKLNTKLGQNIQRHCALHPLPLGLDTGVSALILIKIQACGKRVRERERVSGRVPEVRWGRVSYRFWGLGWARCQRRRTGDCRTWRGRRRRRFGLSEEWGVPRTTGRLGPPPQNLACQSKE